MGRRVAWVAALGLLAGCSSAETEDLEQFRLRVSADRLSFGELAVGDTAEEQLRVTNESSIAVTVTVSGGDDYDQDFDFSPAMATVPAGEAVSLRVTYTPSRSGERSSTLILRADDMRIDPLEVTLTGAGVGGCDDLQVSPSSVEFGAAVLGTQGTATLTLRNRGSGPLEALVDSGDNVGDCDGASGQVTDFCIGTQGLVDDLGRVDIPGNGEIALPMEFNPAVLGSATGFLSVRAQAACPEVAVPVSGVAVDNGLACSDRISFGTVFPGTCATESITCTNEAAAQLTIVDWGRRPGSSQPRALTTEMFAGPVVLERSESVSFDVVYCPEEVGALTGEIGVEQADGPRIDVPVQGGAGGPRLVVEPGTVDFGDVAVLAPARAQVRLTNDGFDVLEISQITFDSMDLSADTTALVLDPGESAVVSVELTAFTGGAFEGRMQIVSNDVGGEAVEVLVIANALNLPSCAFRIDPVVELGVAELGRTVYRTLAVENIGGGDCLVTGVRLLGGSDTEIFLPDDLAGSTLVPPGDLLGVRIGYAPTAVGTNNARLEVAVSSRSQPFNSVPIDGAAVERGPHAYPQRVDFTEVDAQCAGLTRTVRIRNASSQAWTGLQAALVNANVAGFALGMESVPPTLAAGQSFDLSVTFDPSRDGRFANALRVFGTQGGATVSVLVDLLGARTASPSVQESFTLVSGQPVDVLVIADWISNVPSQLLRPAGLGAITSFFDTVGIDWQVGVSTPYRNEGGRLVGMDTAQAILRSDDADPGRDYDQILGNRINGGNFNTLFDFLSTIREATSAPVLLTQNQGFLRPEARLGVVLVSRRADQSPISPEIAVEQAYRTKGYDRRNDVRIHAIGGPSDGSCLGTQPTQRIAQAADLAGGRFESVCDMMFDAALGRIAQDIAGRQDSFVLRATPDVGTLEVRVDGSLVPATATDDSVNWTYDPARNRVTFSPAMVPEPGAQLDITYTPACG